MESSQAIKLMPIHLDISTFTNAILANTNITDKIGTRLTMLPPKERVYPFIFFELSEPTQNDTDDMQAIWFRHYFTFRLVADSTWTQREMRDLMELVMFELRKFQGTRVPAETMGNAVQADLYLVDPTFEVFFGDESQKGYQSMVYYCNMQWK